MITLNHVVRRKQGISREAFRDFWLEEHAKLQLVIAPGIGVRKYIKCETQFEDELHQTLVDVYGTAKDGYDFVDQMYINDFKDFKNGITDSNVCELLQKAHAACAEFVDFARSDYWFSIEIPQVFTRESCIATYDTTYIKVFYVPQRLPHLTLAQAQFHWIACHGAMARQFIQHEPFDKYLQGHRVESAVLDQFKALLGSEFENRDTNIGQAEAWIKRETFNSLKGPEAERMMRMLVADIDLFVNPKISHYLGTKEHFILDQPVITEPVPALFDLN